MLSSNLLVVLLMCYILAAEWHSPSDVVPEQNYYSWVTRRLTHHMIVNANNTRMIHYWSNLIFKNTSTCHAMGINSPYRPGSVCSTCARSPRHRTVIEIERINVVRCWVHSGRGWSEQVEADVCRCSEGKLDKWEDPASDVTGRLHVFLKFSDEGENNMTHCCSIHALLWWVWWVDAFYI